MSGTHLGGSCCRRFRLGMLALFLLTVGGVAMLSQAMTRAGAPPFAPHAVAFFPSNDRLTVAVSAPDAQPLSVELLGADAKRVATGKQAGARFEIAADKAKADGYTLRIRQGERRKDIPLKDVLLAKAHETSLVAGQEFFAGSKTAVRVSVHGVRSARETVALPGAEVVIRLRGTAKDAKASELYSGKLSGDANIQLPIPAVAQGQYILEVSTRSALGEEKLERQVRVKSEARILLVSDRPIYQPGHVIHLRALALRPFDLKPVERAPILFEVEDAKGNKVFKKTLETSDYGIAAVDFQLADEVNMGDYQLKAALGETRTQKTVAVKRYVLPKFKTHITSDKNFYLPKEKVNGSVQVDYFFGKPVAGGKVEVIAETFDVAFRKFQTWNGKTDANGHAKFEIQLPDYFVGTPLQKGNALVKLEIKVTDTADHGETVTRTYNVSDQPIRVSLIPEGGRLVPGLENRVFAAAIYPDGSPAVCDVKLWLGKEAKGDPLATVKTNDAGLAEFRFTPQAAQFRTDGNNEQRNVEMLGGQVIQAWAPRVLLDVRAEAKDGKGSKAMAVAELLTQPLGENVLLRLDKAVYKAGDAVKVEVSTSAGLPTAYVDVIRGGQVLLSRWLEVKDGRAAAQIDLPQTAFGTLEIHAYQMLRSGEIIRDSRVVYAQTRDDLKIKVHAEKDVHQPGENGRIRFEVTDSQGRPTAAALGVIVVDEAVYALQEMQPGLEKVYFTLQEELLKPSVQVQYRPSDTINNLVRRPMLRADKQQVAEVLLTAVRPRPPARWEVAPEVERRNQFESQIQQIGWGLYQYAWGHDGFMKQDAAGRWEFRPNLLQELAKTGQVNPAALQSALGGPLTLESLARTEKGFDLKHLAAALTQQRMKALADAFVQYTGANKDKFDKDGRWTFPAAVLSDAARSQGLSEPCVQDAWGQGFKLVAVAGKRANPTGHTQFDQYDIVSAGPDRDYQTADDVAWTQNQKRTVGGWWANGGQQVRLALAHPRLQQLERAGRERFDRREMLQNQLRFGARPGGFGGGRGLGAPQAGAMPMNAPRAAMKAAAQDRQGRGENKLREVKDAAGAAAGEGGAAPAMRLREFFPETMLWQPALITDDKGVAQMAVNFADSITTWRLSASASSRGGALGGVNVPLRVFQDFFVDLDLPVALTQNDEVAFPVAVYNYLKTPQTVRIELQAEPWFSLLDEGGLVRKLNLKPNEVTSVKFRIRANKAGWQPLTLKAFGSKMSDAVKRVVEVVPDGQKVERVVNDRLSGRVQQTLEIPQDAVPDSSKLLVRIYPGVVAQLMDGMESMLRLPCGCMEQTSSAAYPNILVVDYIKKAKIASPATLMKAEQFLNVGYQRLLTFERPGGGFDWWGSGPPLVWLSAYGLQEFNDMAKVYPVDRGVIDRTQNWLMKQRDKDGTWSNIGATHSETIASMGNPKLLLTSYVTWSLLESGLAKDQLKQSVEYIRGHVNDAGESAYVLALAANALAAYDAKDDSTHAVLRRLDKHRKEVPEWKAANFPAKTTSISYARGDGVTIETTALTVLAMLKSGEFNNSVNQALTYLIKAKQANGTWGGTQATILALKALLGGIAGPPHKGRTPFVIKVNGEDAARGEVTEENADVMQVFDLKAHTKPGPNRVEIEVKGETALMYQIVGRHYQPWKKQPVAAKKPVLDVQVEYDRTKLATSDLLRAKATLKYNGPVPTYQVILDLGIAPGFTVDAGDFAEMVGKKQIQRFSVTARQITLYLGDIRPGDARTFEYVLRPRFPIRAQAPSAVAYEYYTPSNRAVSRPVQLTVTEKK